MSIKSPKPKRIENYDDRICGICRDGVTLNTISREGLDEKAPDFEDQLFYRYQERVSRVRFRAFYNHRSLCAHPACIDLIHPATNKLEREIDKVARVISLLKGTIPYSRFNELHKSVYEKIFPRIEKEARTVKEFVSTDQGMNRLLELSNDVGINAIKEYAKKHFGEFINQIGKAK